jgi:TadE-like protein.
MALILPFLLAFAGGATDLARVYQAWLTLESGVRNAAEYVATNSANSGTAAVDAQRIVCLEASKVPGFVPGSGPKPLETCSAPAVTVPTFSTSTTDIGATAKNPIGTAKVSATLTFNMLFAYPFLPSHAWTLSADASYSVVRNR